MVGPLIAPPTGPLATALTELSPGETWLVEPHELDTAGTTPGTSWSPGVRLGVQAGSWFHRTECFGPVLGLMRARDLDHAIQLQNDSHLALTGGIHSLDDAEVDQWLERVEIGNAYINRHITGAIVQRQPFGGWKRSSVGGGAKAGGPGYVTQFARVVDRRTPGIAAVRSGFSDAWSTYFGTEHDDSQLTAEANILRYIPLQHVEVRTQDDGFPLDVLRAAAAVTGVALGVSSTSDETDIEFAQRLAAAKVRTDRVRVLCEISWDACRILHDADIAIDRSDPVSNSKIEIQRWVKEQAISRTLHRHGRLI
jgi:RHH-type proline utilization regulon transcriptional repressor/proline dehydrogenase/delta 1-pyrroline-5-carboxylate dehydrogenase